MHRLPLYLYLMTIAALFVESSGIYGQLADIELWPEGRDARLYAGLFPVVAHPPCARWGRYWWGGPSSRQRYAKGDDGGCFENALACVRAFGGVLEHPSASSAWDAYGLKKPPRKGCWVPADSLGGFTCCVDQGHYGHRAQKATWLYANVPVLPALIWGKLLNISVDRSNRRAVRTGICQRMSKRERTATPKTFAELLVSIARRV